MKHIKSKYDFRLNNNGFYSIFNINNSKYYVYNFYGIYYFSKVKIHNPLEILVNQFSYGYKNKIYISYNSEFEEKTYHINNYNKFTEIIDIDNNISGTLYAVGTTPIIETKGKKYIKTKNGLVNVKNIDCLFIDENNNLWSNYGKVIDKINYENSCIIYLTEDLYVISQYGDPVLLGPFLLKDNLVYQFDENNEWKQLNRFSDKLEFKKVLQNEIRNQNKKMVI